MPRLPVLFVAHGAPPLLDDDLWKSELARWAQTLPRPAAILVISAHWESRPVTIGATRALPLIYDFYGFPERYYTVKYAAPGAPALAARLRTLLADAGIASTDAPERGLDHGTYVPLLSMYPEADVPVIQLSIPTLDPKVLAGLGLALAPLRDEGVLLVGSGFLTHNLSAFGLHEVPWWAVEFDAWTADTLARGDLDALVNFEARAPGARLAHPRTEHFVPVVVAAAAGAGDAVRFPVEGWWMGMPFSKRSVQWG